jgi:hypothetical protein
MPNLSCFCYFANMSKESVLFSKSSLSASYSKGMKIFSFLSGVIIMLYFLDSKCIF